MQYLRLTLKWQQPAPIFLNIIKQMIQAFTSVEFQLAYDKVECGSDFKMDFKEKGYIGSIVL